MILGFALTDVIAIACALGSCIYTLSKAIEWLNSHFLHWFETSKTKTEEELEGIQKSLKEIQGRLDKNEADVLALKDASISRIKGKIVDYHSRFIALGYIDYRSLDCVQQQFKAYEAMGGNSYVHDLVKDLEGLPLKD